MKKSRSLFSQSAILISNLGEEERLPLIPSQCHESPTCPWSHSPHLTCLATFTFLLNPDIFTGDTFVWGFWKIGFRDDFQNYCHLALSSITLRHCPLSLLFSMTKVRHAVALSLGVTPNHQSNTNPTDVRKRLKLVRDTFSGKPVILQMVKPTWLAWDIDWGIVFKVWQKNSNRRKMKNNQLSYINESSNIHHFYIYFYLISISVPSLKTVCCLWHKRFNQFTMTISIDTHFDTFCLSIDRTLPRSILRT